ncbi:hypothetical protein ACFL0U_02125 [Pseudomonadota bacterium]
MVSYNIEERDKLLKFLDQERKKRNKSFEDLKSYTDNLKSERKNKEKTKEQNLSFQDKLDEEDEEDTDGDDDSTEYRDSKKEEAEVLKLIEELCIDARSSKKIPESILSRIKKMGDDHDLEGLEDILGQSRKKGSTKTLLSQIVKSIREELLPSNIRTLDDFRRYLRELSVQAQVPVEPVKSKEVVSKDQEQEQKQEQEQLPEVRQPQKESFVERLSNQKGGQGKGR